MARQQLILPSREERDRLLATTFAGDPQPPICADHGASKPATQPQTCAVCGDYRRWLGRMTKKFNVRGMRLAFGDRTYGDVPDPQPPACPHGHRSFLRNRKTCAACETLYRWDVRRYYRELRDGNPRSITDLTEVIAHVRKLLGGGMIADEIAEQSQCAAPTVLRLVSGAAQRRFVTTGLARRLLAIPVPEHVFALVPTSRSTIRPRTFAVGAQRRIQAMCADGLSLRDQADRLGYPLGTLHHWLRASTLAIASAMDVHQLFLSQRGRPGGDPAAVAYAEARSWLPARYFCLTNIDDPDYQPMRVLTSPCGVRRRLRSLAWMCHGPDEVAAFIDEKPESVRKWTIGGFEDADGTRRPDHPIPAYAVHLCDDAFEALSGRFGDDEQAGREARELGWMPPLAWYDLDIDDPRTRPLVDLASRDSRTNYPLQSQVLQALIGRITAADLLRQEKREVVRILHHAGWSDRRIGRWLRWSDTIEKCGDNVIQFRKREGISGGPRDREAWFSPITDLDFLVTPANT